MFVVRAMRVYPMSLRPGRLYNYALKPVQIKCGADKAFVMAFDHLGWVGPPSYGVTLLRNTFPDSGTVSSFLVRDPSSLKTAVA